MSGLHERAQELLHRTGKEDFDPAKAVKDFAPAEIKEARILAFEGRYLPAHAAMLALEQLSAQRRDRAWLNPKQSRPAGTEVVEIIYFDGDEDEAIVGAGFWHDHVTNGRQWWKVSAFGHWTVTVIGWRPFDLVPEVLP